METASERKRNTVFDNLYSYIKTMNAYESDLKKYWYVRTSTLNKETSLESYIKTIRKQADSKRKAIQEEERRRIKASEHRNTKYVQSVFEKHYWNIDCCMICWEKGYLQIHHKDKNRRNNDFTNLIKICVDCHIKAHEWEKAGEFMKNVFKKNMIHE